MGDAKAHHPSAPDIRLVLRVSVTGTATGARGEGLETGLGEDEWPGPLKKTGLGRDGGREEGLSECRGPRPAPCAAQVMRCGIGR